MFLDVRTLAYALAMFGKGLKSKLEMYLYTADSRSPQIDVSMFSAPITLGQVKNFPLCQVPDFVNILDVWISDSQTAIIGVPGWEGSF